MGFPLLVAVIDITDHLDRVAATSARACGAHSEDVERASRVREIRFAAANIVAERDGDWIARATMSARCLSSVSMNAT